MKNFVSLSSAELAQRVVKVNVFAFVLSAFAKWLVPALDLSLHSSFHQITSTHLREMYCLRHCSILDAFSTMYFLFLYEKTFALLFEVLARDASNEYTQKMLTLRIVTKKKKKSYRFPLPLEVYQHNLSLKMMAKFHPKSFILKMIFLLSGFIVV